MGKRIRFGEQLELLHKQAPRMRALRAYDALEVSVLSGKDTGSETIVQQSFKDEVDVNTIVRRFGLTHQGPVVNTGGLYGDFTGVLDYESAVERVDSIREAFLSLPPEVREEFKNDPRELLAFVELKGPEAFEELLGVPGRDHPDMKPSASVEGAPAPVPAPPAPVPPRPAADSAAS